MNKIYIPFAIGMYYEEVEFEVEVLYDRIIGYDSYLYVGNNFKDIEIELIFYWDILVCILIKSTKEIERYNIDDYLLIKNYYIKSDVKIQNLVVNSIVSM
ncbi:hypothetical protein [Empedobacter sp. UBA5987]|uniref:hypothetical protein n=1 Tax=Empedobacter sp. UBA5987 TaxID=1946444 RepID=UPI0025BF7D2F|nr:hypothetical protein [Empedobacter sp. UBA5987]